ncbi:MAG: MarR family transcriptional regulator [Archangium sp.]|nr:MarR family transcriptional regulator [Archangium sp.]
MTAAYAPLLAPLKVTYPQYLVLLVLWETDGVSVRALGDRLALDSGTLTPLLQKMERAGLVSRARDAEDNRVVRISLTTSGRALKRKALNIPKELVCHFGLTLPAIAQLRSQLNGLTQQLRAATTGSTNTTGETS